jgi:hypothetical protein
VPVDVLGTGESIIVTAFSRFYGLRFNNRGTGLTDTPVEDVLVATERLVDSLLVLSSHNAVAHHSTAYLS